LQSAKRLALLPKFKPNRGVRQEGEDAPDEVATNAYKIKQNKDLFQLTGLAKTASRQ
jgi:hypothetical protein